MVILRVANICNTVDKQLGSIKCSPIFILSIFWTCKHGWLVKKCFHLVTRKLQKGVITLKNYLKNNCNIQEALSECNILNCHMVPLVKNAMEAKYLNIWEIPMINFRPLSRVQSHSPDVNQCIFTFFTQRSPRVSQRGWVPKTGRVPSEG